MKRKTYDDLLSLLDILAEHGYNEIKSELWNDLVQECSTTDDDIDTQVDSFIKNQEDQAKSDQLRIRNMERENKELKKELDKRDKEMQTFLKGLIDTVKDYADCKIDTSPDVKLEMKTCSNIIKSAFSQMTKRIQTAENSGTAKTVQHLEKEIQNLSEINSKQESRLLKYERQLLEAREELDVIKKEAARKDKERAKAIELLKEDLMLKQEEITNLKQSHREAMEKINSQFDGMKMKLLKTTEEHDRKLTAVKDEYSWRMTNMHKDHERKMTELKNDNESLKHDMERSESRMEARLQEMEKRLKQKDSQVLMTSENVAHLPRLLNRQKSAMLIDYSASVPGLTVKRVSRHPDT